MVTIFYDDDEFVREMAQYNLIDLNMVKVNSVFSPGHRVPIELLAFKDQWKNKIPLFRIISIETKTGCNFTCSFCPVSKNIDPRPSLIMSMEILLKLAAELKSINYSDSIFLFCNNEPLLDNRLPNIVKIFRVNCPSARIKILTNGTLLNMDIAHSLFRNGLNVLEIDNYTDGLKLLQPIKKIIELASDFRKNKIKIHMRKQNEILNNRAGNSPNSEALNISLNEFCALPFTDINIMPDGNVSLCCVDALSEEKVGNIIENDILSVWKGKRLNEVRESLLNKNREAINICSRCDYNGFRTPPKKPRYI